MNGLKAIIVLKLTAMLLYTILRCIYTEHEEVSELNYWDNNFGLTTWQIFTVNNDIFL